MLAIIGAGGVFAGTNPAYTRHELRHHIRVTKAQFLISEPEILSALVEAAEGQSIPRENIRIFHPHSSQKCPSGFLSWTELFEHGERDWVRFDDLETCRTTQAARLTSSGTTGLPKATMTTHYNLIAQHEICYGAHVYRRPYEVVHLWSLPMFHAAVAPRAHTTNLKIGEKAYIMRRFELEQYLANIERYQVTELYMVSAMAVAVVMSPLIQKYSLRSIRGGVAGAAPLSKETQERVRVLIAPKAPFTQVWAMTESTCTMTWFDWPEDDVTGSVGRFRPGLEAKLVDDHGNDISGYDVRGEMCVRGPTLIPGYFENEAANRESFDAQGFFHTGDIMYCDGRTKLWYIVDRKKELIKVRGFQVAPPEIEAVLLQHPQIVDCAVIGIPADELDGDWPRAYVVRRTPVDAAQPSSLTEQDVVEYAGRQLARYKRLEGGVRFVDAIPKNASGKILKRIIREWATEEREKEKKQRAKL